MNIYIIHRYIDVNTYIDAYCMKLYCMKVYNKQESDENREYI